MRPRVFGFVLGPRDLMEYQTNNQNHKIRWFCVQNSHLISQVQAPKLNVSSSC